MKKVITCFLLIVFDIVVMALSVMSCKILVHTVNNWGIHSSFYYYLGVTIVCITSAVVFSILTYKQIKGSNASNFVRYTYEEYKAYRTKKKEEKQAKKRAKLQEKIDKIQKTE